MTSTIKQLTENAKAVLAIDEVPEFLEGVEQYLEAFDVWQKAFTANNPLAESSGVGEKEKLAIRAEVNELIKVHLELAQTAEQNKGKILERMGDIRKRSQALKTYIDRYPKRITITGKREG